MLQGTWIAQNIEKITLILSPTIVITNYTNKNDYGLKLDYPYN